MQKYAKLYRVCVLFISAYLSWAYCCGVCVRLLVWGCVYIRW